MKLNISEYLPYENVELKVPGWNCRMARMSNIVGRIYRHCSQNISTFCNLCTFFGLPKHTIFGDLDLQNCQPFRSYCLFN